MTNGELFKKENPTVETKINGSCVWIYFDVVNHYTMPVSWWKQEIGLLDKIRAKIEEIAFDWQEIDGEHESFMVVDLNDVFQIIDKYRTESEDKE